MPSKDLHTPTSNRGGSAYAFRLTSTDAKHVVPILRKSFTDIAALMCFSWTEDRRLILKSMQTSVTGGSLNRSLVRAISSMVMVNGQGNGQVELIGYQNL